MQMCNITVTIVLWRSLLYLKSIWFSCVLIEKVGMCVCVCYSSVCLSQLSVDLCVYVCV